MKYVDYQSTAESAIPVTILTGFLGAGKTTLLNRILNGNHGLRVAVMVNDFGSVNIDKELVTGVSDKVINLANGCICCQINDDLVLAVQELLESDQSPEYILVEASGIADPSSVALAFLQSRFRESIRLDSVTSLVDAEQLFTNRKLLELKKLQIAYSDLMILNKVDLIDAAGLEKVKAWIGRYFRAIRMIEASYADVPLEILLSVGRFDPAQLEKCPLEPSLNVQGQTRHGRFTTCSYESDAPLSLEKLRRAVSALPETIYRVKGIVHAGEAPQRRAVLQAVGRRTDVALLDGWADQTPRTRIVAIGAPGSIDAERLRLKLDPCRADAPAVAAGPMH